MLSVFVECGLIEALSTLAGRQSSVTAKATNLLGELLHMSNTLLPHNQCANIQVNPKKSEFYADFGCYYKDIVIAVKDGRILQAASEALGRCGYSSD